MISLTQKERETILILFKEYTNYYNANSISKILKISHVGAQKILKKLLKENIVNSKKIGKAIIYKPNLKDNYVKQLITFLLADEANNFKRWKEEFKKLFKKNRIIMIYGSAIKNYAKAKDIDIMITTRKFEKFSGINKVHTLLTTRKEEIKEINKILKEKEQILPKKLHAIKLTNNDLLKNLKKKDKAIIDIVKNAIILYGQDKYVEMLKKLID